MSVHLDDSRWWNGEFELFSLIDKTAASLAEPPDDPEDGLRCSACEVSVGEDRFALVIHYRSDWHKYNLRRKMQGKSVISEEDFEQKVSDGEETGGSLSSGTDGEEDAAFSGGVHEYFVHSGNVYSLYNCILRDGEHPSSSFFARPLNCTIFLLAGGHFSGGIFKDDQLVAHKSFHRYTVRAKQGGSQSVSDNRHGKAKSAGATLRRYNERALRDDIHETISSWSNMIRDSPLVFIRSPTYNRCLFVSDSLQNTPFLRSDDRLRTIPFETHRPSIDELMRVWQRLRVVREHGTVDEFRKEVEEKRKLRKKKLCLLRSRHSRKDEARLSDFSSDGETEMEGNVLKPEACPTASVTSKDEPRTTQASQQPPNDEIKVDGLSEEEKQLAYLAIRTDSVEKLENFIASDRRQLLIDYVRSVRFPPDSSSFLHVAAKRDARRILAELLLLGCDPSVKDAAGIVPYEVSANRSVKRVFSEYRAKDPNACDWKACHIPELTVATEEKLKKEAERRKQQKERRKLKEKAQKEEERLEKALQAERDAFLALSDREKRALAAERRFAASVQVSGLLVENPGNRCFQCGNVLPAKPFEYSDNRFCQVSCVIAHRRANEGTVSK